MCSCCSDCFCSACTIDQYISIKGSKITDDPIRYCRVCLDKIRASEHMLRFHYDDAIRNVNNVMKMELFRRAIDACKLVSRNVNLITETEVSYHKLVASCNLQQAISDVVCRVPVTDRSTLRWNLLESRFKCTNRTMYYAIITHILNQSSGDKSEPSRAASR